jgi:hypothetical protein
MLAGDVASIRMIRSSFKILAENSGKKGLRERRRNGWEYDIEVNLK